MKKTKRKSLLIMALLLLVCITSGYVASTYAKYTSDVTGDGTITVAKWNFEEDNSSIKTFNINLSKNYDSSTLVNNKIAPGTEGSFSVKLLNTSEVGVEFAVTLGDASLDNDISLPKNLKFYSDKEHKKEFTPGEDNITGKLKANDETGVDVTIYWKWDYYTNDEDDKVDTEAGEKGATLTIPVTVTGTQVEPSETTITTGITPAE